MENEKVLLVPCVMESKPSPPPPLLSYGSDKSIESDRRMIGRKHSPPENDDMLKPKDNRVRSNLYYRPSAKMFRTSADVGMEGVMEVVSHSPPERDVFLLNDAQIPIERTKRVSSDDAQHRGSDDVRQRDQIYRHPIFEDANQRMNSMTNGKELKKPSSPEEGYRTNEAQRYNISPAHSFSPKSTEDIKYYSEEERNSPLQRSYSERNSPPQRLYSEKNSPPQRSYSERNSPPQHSYSKRNSPPQRSYSEREFNDPFERKQRFNTSPTESYIDRRASRDSSVDIPIIKQQSLLNFQVLEKTDTYVTLFVEVNGRKYEGRLRIDK